MIKVIIFDLDGTLYKSDEIRQKFAEAAYYTLAEFKNTSVENAQTLIEERRDALKRKQGFPVPYTLTLISYGVPIPLWHKENIKFFDPRDYLNKDEKLKKSMIRLNKHYKLAILTNNNDVQTARILQALELDDLFEGIFTYTSFKLLKPDLKFFERAASEMGVKPEECLVVGDRYNVDLEPAKKLGMDTYEVNGPEDIYNLPHVV